MFIVTDVQKRWLYRKIEISSPVGTFELIYNGHGLGYEEILVNGEIAVRKSSFFWYVPKFEFNLGNFQAEVEVEVSYSFQIKHFNLEIDGYDVYFE